MNAYLLKFLRLKQNLRFVADDSCQQLPKSGRASTAYRSRSVRVQLAEYVRPQAQEGYHCDCAHSLNVGSFYSRAKRVYAGSFNVIVKWGSE